MLCLMNVLWLASIFMSLTGLVPRSPRALSPRAVVEAKFAAVNHHVVADVVRHYAPDARITSSGFCAPRQGKAEVQRTYQALIGTFPDIVAEVKEYVVEGDRVAVIFVTRVQVQGKTFEVPIANFFTVKDGLITRDDGVYDAGGRPCAR
jgi:ketosteroid isomerase-like protein